MKLNRLLLASTTLICVTLLGNTSGIAKTENITAKNPHRLLASSMKHENEMQGGNPHHHTSIEIPAGQPVPSVNLIVHPDSMKGWNLEIQVSNFRFAPEHVNTEPRMGEGHAHLYVNGEKITRIYSSWYYLGHLKPGRNEITVTLSANNHADFIWNGEVIKDTKIIEINALN